MIIMGLDQSLNGTAMYLTGGVGHELLNKVTTDPIPRLAEIRHRVQEVCHHHQPKLVVMEDYSYTIGVASRSAGLGELGGVLRLLFYELKQPLLVVNPSQLKKFIVGTGNAPKEKMILRTFQLYHVEFPDNNVTDAFGLAMIGMAYYDDVLILNNAQKEVIEALRKKGLASYGIPQVAG